MMTSTPLLIAFLVGWGLGMVFFTALWLTVRHLPRATNPVLLMLGSGLARMAIALPVFYFLADGQWQRLACALAGFVLARSLLILRWRPPVTAAPALPGD